MENKNIGATPRTMDGQDMYAASISPREISIGAQILRVRWRVEKFVDDFAEKLYAEYEMKDPDKSIRFDYIISGGDLANGSLSAGDYIIYWRKRFRENIPCIGHVQPLVFQFGDIDYWMPKGTRAPKSWDVNEDIENWNKAWMEDYEETRKQERKLFDLVFGNTERESHKDGAQSHWDQVVNEINKSSTQDVDQEVWKASCRESVIAEDVETDFFKMAYATPSQKPKKPRWNIKKLFPRIFRKHFDPEAKDRVQITVSGWPWTKSEKTLWLAFGANLFYNDGRENEGGVHFCLTISVIVDVSIWVIAKRAKI